MFVRLHLIEPAAAPAARLFAIRHSQGHLVRDGDGAVVIGTDVVELDKRRRALNVATVAHIVALVPESDVREGEATSLVPDALVAPLAALLDVGQKALARHMRVEPPLTLDDLREIAHGMGFELTPSLPTVPSLDEMRELLGRMRAEPDAPQPDSSADVERALAICPRCGTTGLTHHRSPAGDVFHCVRCKAMPADELVGLLLQPPCWPPRTVLDRHRIACAMAERGLSWKPTNGAASVERQGEPLPDAPTDAEHEPAAQAPGPDATASGEQAHQGQPEVAQAAPAPKPDAEPKAEKKRKPRA